MKTALNTHPENIPQRPGATRVIYIPIQDIHPNPNNPRLHKADQIRSLVKSIQSFGFNIPIAVDKQGQIIAGHARLEAAKKLEMQEVPVVRLEHLTPDQAKAFTLADNRLCELSSWDDHLLSTQLKELSLVNLEFDLEATGFSVGDIDLRIESLGLPVPEEDEPELPAGPAVSRLGDLWLLGPHRVLCGNAQISEDFMRLMEDRVADMIITDPPFNVRVQGHVGGKGRIKHAEFKMASGEMSEAEFTQFLQTAFVLMAKHSHDGSVHAVFSDWRHLPEFLAAGKQVYSSLLNLCVWVKHQAGMGSLYRSQHELILIYKNGTASHQNHVQLGRFGRFRSNVWQFPGIQAMRHGEEGDLLAMHPTCKPVRMISEAILDCSRRGEIILDPFLGSGTTLMASENVGRHCYAMELDPRYVDTAIRRWQALTGQDAVDAKTGATFTERQQQYEVSHD